MQAVQRKTEYKAQPQSRPRNRVVKIEGNVAYISNGFDERKQRPVASAKPAAKPAARPKAKPAARPKAGLISTLMMTLIAFAAMALLVSRYAEASAVGARNNDLKENIAAVETQIDALKIDIEMKDDLLYVKQTAQQQMGMTYPSPDQVVVINPGG